MTKKTRRLLTDISPKRYEIVVRPDFLDNTFSGQENIFLTFKKTTKNIILHSAGLKIFEVNFKNKTGEIRPKDISYDKKTETVTLNFSKVFSAGEGELFLKFKGKLADDMRGFYKSKYKVEGEERFLATTQFESTDARRAFPCIDEPEAKAIFDVTMIVPKHHQAISNTIPTEVLEHQNGYKVVKFAPTPLMSTYLLAFISGEFEFIEGENDDGVLVRVFTTPGKKKYAEFALDVAKKSLEFYTKYFGIPYPLPVLDMIATPDFASGAMENWGAVTYRESALLVDPDNTAAEDKQWVALVVAHELAHQWFGNLVTMKWWTDLWLNEGFASYIEYLAIDNIFPEWDIWKQFVSRELGVAMRLDALLTTHPIEVSVNHPHEISEIFDAVSYSKGAVVIRMLAEYLGEKDFRRGLGVYLKRFSYSNAETQDLWQVLEEVSKKPVKKIMINWTKKSGYPILSFFNKGKKNFIRQRRFFLSPYSEKLANDKTLWQVPVLWSNGSGKKRQLLNKSHGPIDISLENFSKINVGEVGLFRTLYPHSFFLKIREDIKNKKLDVLDRLGIVRDVFALSESGNLSSIEALSILDFFREEKEYVVWVEIASGLARFAQVFSGEPWYEKFVGLKRDTFSTLAESLGWSPKKDEHFTVSMLRDLALFQAGSSGNEKINIEAKNQFEKYLSSGQPPHKDIRSAVYLLVARSGLKDTYAKFLNLYKNAHLSDERERLGEALGYFSNRSLLTKTLNFCLTDDVRPQDFFSIFRSVARNINGRDLIWAFVKKNWPRLLKIYGSGGHAISKVIEPLGMLADDRSAREIKAFFKKQKPIGVERTVSQVLEMIVAKSAWRKREGKKLARWFQNL